MAVTTADSRGTGTTASSLNRASSARASAIESEYNNPAHRIAFIAAVLYIFVKAGTIHELLSQVAGHNLFLLYFVGPPALLGALLCGAVRVTMEHRIAWWMIGFTAWTALTIPFSSWVGGSAVAFLAYARYELPFLFLAAGIVVKWEELRRILFIIAVSVVCVIAFVQLQRGAGGAGRLDLGFGGTIANANDYAAHLLLFLPIAAFFALRPGTWIGKRLFWMAVVGAGLFHVARTASRGALIAMAVAGIFLFIRGTMMQRLAVVVLLPVLVAGALLVLPSDVVNRLVAFSSSDEAPEEAVMSKNEREYLLRQSIRFTFERPIFGVGVNQFSAFEGARSESEGRRGNWHLTHNAYTQVSSECGIPGLILYLAVIVLSVRALNRVWRKAVAAGHREMALASMCVLTGMVAFYVAIIFLSLAYRVYTPLLAGLAIAFERVANLQLQSAPSGAMASRNAAVRPAQLAVPSKQ